jgi:DNA-binding response OmpR family regulator
MDKILGLEYGADDYITKPFNILEVKARIKAITRRNKRKNASVTQEQKVIISGNLKLDIEAKRLYIKDIEIKLTVKEFDILKLLAENPGKIYSREQLLTIIWGSKYPGDARTVDVNVRRLREKIEENPAKPEYVHTKWGMGYYFQG